MFSCTILFDWLTIKINKKMTNEIPMDIKLWRQLLTETVYWQEINDHMCLDILQRTALAWAHDQTYYLQSGPERVDLTKLYEQYRLLSVLKGSNHDNEIPRDS